MTREEDEVIDEADIAPAHEDVDEVLDGLRRDTIWVEGGGTDAEGEDRCECGSGGAELGVPHTMLNYCEDIIGCETLLREQGSGTSLG